MGLQTEFFLGSVEDALDYDGAPVTNLEPFQLGGLTNLEFETLRAIVEGENWDAKRHALEQIASTEASWTFRFPAAYVDSLQSLDKDTMKRTASEWAATKEVASSASDVLPVIELLVALAQSASETRRYLFLWIAL